MRRQLVVCLLFALVIFDAKNAALAAPPIEQVMEKLIQTIAEQQVLKPQQYKPPATWEEKLGLYRSEVRIDFFGEPAEAELRKNKFVYVFDNNMFATGWILTVLLEANMYGRAPATIDNEHLSLALDTLETFHDHNQLEDSVPIMTFWSQIFNKTTNTWVSTPDNLRELILHFDEVLEPLEKLLKTLGIEKAAELIDAIIAGTSMFMQAFEIPPDFDDTYLNIGLGATLKNLQDKYPSSFLRWTETNGNMKALSEITTRYAYRASSSDDDQRILDPRTYFWMREFIRENPQALIATTWVQNITEVRRQAHAGVRMPFNLNNVDVTVGANVLYGMTSAILSDLLDFPAHFGQDMQDLYLSTASLITWAIKNSMAGRPDLAQVYYPSHYNFLWYGSRTLFLLERAHRENRPMPDVFSRVYTMLGDTYRNFVVNFFQQNVRIDSESYDDFLGVNDTNIFGKIEPTGEDRIFSTSQTVNVLIASFTYFNASSGTLQWISNGKELDSIKFMITKSASWLLNNAFALKPFNCFFSGSVKGFEQLPFWYPANVYQFLNGSTFDPDQIKADTASLIDSIVGVRGYIDELDYEKMINQKHFNQSTPTTFNGYNVAGAEFPFWSSQPYTHATTLLALAQYNNLEK